LTIQRKRVAKRLASGLLAGALALGGLAISGSTASAVTPDSPTTNRIGGDDRYETSALLARDFYTGRSPAVSLGAKGLIVASGESPYDALAASALSGFVDAPIVLVKKDSIPESVDDLLSDIAVAVKASIGQKVYVIGGTAAVSDDVLEGMKSTLTASDATPITFQRVAGDDRYKTAQAIAAIPGVMNASDRIVVVNGADGRWADALSASGIAAANAWPVVTTGDGGLNDTAKAVIATYLKLPGSAAKFLLVGGPAVMPTSVEDHLVGSLVAPANIDRRGGVDRYQTNLLLNSYALSNSSSKLVGKNVALASGETPWDALSAGPWGAARGAGSGIHIALTNSSSLNASTTALAGALQAADYPSSLYIVGGKSAVATSVGTAWIAASSSNTVTSTMTCTPNSTKVYVTFSSALRNAGARTPNSGNFQEGTLFVNARTTAGVWKLNSANNTPASIATDSVGLNGDADNVTYEVTMSSALTTGDVVSFAGLLESSTLGRAIGGSSCTAGADTTAPSATLRAVVTGTAPNEVLDHVIVTLTEPIQTIVGGAALSVTKAGGYEGATAANGATLSANAGWSALGSASDANSTTLGAQALNTSGTVWKVSVTATSLAYSNVTLAAGATVTLTKEALKDLAGINAAADISTVAVNDPSGATGVPVVTVGVLTCAPAATTAEASLTRGGFTATAKKTGNAGGVAGNGYRMTVVNSRGLILPTVAVDSTAKTITVTMDTGYHTAADLVTATNNSGINAVNWTFTSTATAVTATTTPVSVLSANLGTQKCQAVLSLTEAGLVSATPTVSVNNVSATVDAGLALSPTSYLMLFRTSQSGGVSITGTVADQKATPSSGSFTATGTAS